MELLYKLLGIATAAAEGAAEAIATAAPTEIIGTGTDTNIGGPANAFQYILSFLIQFSPIILMVVVMYFLMIRPERKRRKKEKAMLDALKRGDRICTIGGIYGTIMDIKDDTITLAVGRDNLSMVVARWAIRSVEDVKIENESEALN